MEQEQLKGEIEKFAQKFITRIYSKERVQAANTAVSYFFLNKLSNIYQMFDVKPEMVNHVYKTLRATDASLTSLDPRAIGVLSKYQIPQKRLPNTDIQIPDDLLEHGYKSYLSRKRIVNGDKFKLENLQDYYQFLGIDKHYAFAAKATKKPLEEVIIQMKNISTPMPIIMPESSYR